MTRGRVGLGGAIWLGLSLASLFFYPLLSALGEQVFYLHWRRSDSLELLIGFALLAICLGSCLWLIERGSARWRVLGYLLVAAVPLASFSIQVVRQLHFEAELRSLAAAAAGHVNLLAVLATIALLAAGSVVARFPAACARLLRGVLLLLSPLALLFAVTLLRVGLHETDRSMESAPLRPASSASAQPPASTYVVLFDELSYRHLYDEDGRVRAGYPHIRRFADAADNYHDATSPGRETGTALPGLLTNRRDLAMVRVAGRTPHAFRHDGTRAPLDLSRGTLFETAQAAGLETAMFGWYYPYCELLQGQLTACRSLSPYNFSSTVDTGFSLTNPFISNAILWPNQMPFGAAKNPAACASQREMVARTFEASMATIERRAPVFLFAHFSIPHVPFAFDAEGYAPPSRPYAEDYDAYRGQLAYADQVFGRLLAALEQTGQFEAATIVLLSDHDLRVASTARRERIPLIVKRPGQVVPQSRTAPTRAEQILAGLESGRS